MSERPVLFSAAVDQIAFGAPPVTAFRPTPRASRSTGAPEGPVMLTLRGALIRCWLIGSGRSVAQGRGGAANSPELPVVLPRESASAWQCGAVRANGVNESMMDGSSKGRAWEASGWAR